MVKRILILFSVLSISLVGVEALADMQGHSSSSGLVQTLGSAVNAGVAGMMFSMCRPPDQIWPCILGGMASSQSGNHSGASRGSYNTAKELTNSYALPQHIDLDGDGEIDIYDTGDPNYMPVYGTKDEFNKQVADLQNKFKEKGVIVDEANGTVTVEGEEFKMADVNAAMASGNGSGVGLSSGEISKLKKAIAKKEAEVKDQFRVSSMKDARAVGGGGSGSRSYKFKRSSTDFGKLFGKLNRKPSSAKAEGLKRMVDGQPIGVKGDNLFDMVHRRYEKKRSSSNFLE